MIRGALYERLVFRELLLPFIITLSGLSILFLMAKLLSYIEPLLKAGITAAEFARLVVLMLPVFLKIIIPIATLLGALLAAMRLSRDSEIIALFACGAGIFRLFRPFIAFALVCWLATLVISTVVVPAAKHAYRTFMKEITEAVFTRGLPEKVFFSPYPGLTFYINDEDENGRDLEGIYIRDVRLEKMPYQMLARSGHIAVRPDKASIVLSLENGTMTSHSNDTLDILKFDSYALSLSTPSKRRGRRRGEMGLYELYNTGHSIDVESEYARSCLVELHKRVAIPVGTLIFGVVALPLGVFLGRTGLAGGIATGLAGFLVYYIALVFASNVAEQGALPAYISLWLPNTVFGVVAYLLVRRLTMKGPVSFL